MKKILISIRPKWCEKIASGKKTIEVRKSAPKEVPFKAYIYETKGKKIECGFHFEDTGITLREKYVFGMHKARIIKHYRDEGRGKVIGEFICDKVSTYPRNYKFGYEISENEFNETALTAEQFVDYGNGGTLYGWHISDLKIFDKPKELSEFSRHKEYCHTWGFNVLSLEKITRPPQSYMFVEELGE